MRVTGLALTIPQDGILLKTFLQAVEIILPWAERTRSIGKLCDSSLAASQNKLLLTKGLFVLVFPALFLMLHFVFGKQKQHF